MENKIKKRQLKADLLEFIIVVMLIVMTISIYVPKAIWEEEHEYQKTSRFFIQNVFDTEMFYNSLTDSFNISGSIAMDLINTVRDSIHADSNFVGKQKLLFNGDLVTVNIAKDFHVEYDTTFGFQKTRRDTLVDTLYTIMMYSEDLNKNDTLFINQKQLNQFKSDENYVGIVDSETKLRTELVNYYDSYFPTYEMLNCPLTDVPYQISLTENKTGVRVASPIKDVYKESRYLLFSFNAQNHGYINDGVRSWD